MEKMLFCVVLYVFLCGFEFSVVAPISISSEFTISNEFYDIPDHNLKKRSCPTLDPDIAEDVKLDPVNFYFFDF